MKHTFSLVVEALADPDTYTWYTYQGERLRLKLSDARVYHLEHLQRFGLRALGKVFYLRSEADGVPFGCRINPEQYQTLVRQGRLLKAYALDYATVGRRIRLSNKTFIPVLTRIVHTLGADSDRTQHLLVVLASTLAALMHSYGIALTRVKRTSVSDSVIHDRFVGKMLAFLLEGHPVKEIPKTRINGYEMFSVLSPPKHGYPLSPACRGLFVLAKKQLMLLIKTRMPKVLKILIDKESVRALQECDDIAREAVLLCSVMAELLVDNPSQALFNARQLRLMRLD